MLNDFKWHNKKLSECLRKINILSERARYHSQEMELAQKKKPMKRISTHILSEKKNVSEQSEGEKNGNEKKECAE